MEITPATFEMSDRYHESMVEAVRRLAVVHSYGIVPGTAMNVTTTVVDGNVIVQVHMLQAVSKSGELFHIAGDSLSRQLPHAKGRECYLAVHVDGEVEQEVNGVLYSKPKYAYDYCSLEEIDAGCIPVAKLCLENDNWSVQDLYIPPCMVVNSHPELMNIVAHTRERLHSIVSLLTTKHHVGDMLAIQLLLMDIDDVSGTEIPEDFYLLLRKIAWALSSMHLTGITLPELPSFPPFNNNDILNCIAGILKYLAMYESVISVETQEHPKEEKPHTSDVAYIEI